VGSTEAGLLDWKVENRPSEPGIVPCKVFQGGMGLREGKPRYQGFSPTRLGHTLLHKLHFLRMKPRSFLKQARGLHRY
jgi:hypothetical protein